LKEGGSRPDAVELSNDPSSVAAARAFVRGRCVSAGLPDELCDLAALLTSETVTNAFVHGRSDVRLGFESDVKGVTVTVQDDDTRLPVLGRLDDYEALGGRGMAILAQLAASWGTYAVTGGKVVWFRVDRT
jgi:anti-sigma regulatory factor (Ser/Thr protein kinase)